MISGQANTEKRESQLFAVINRFSVLAVRAEDAIDRVSSRCAPLLRDQGPTPGIPAPQKQMQEPLVKAVEMLTEYAVRIDLALDRLDSVNHRLEI